MTDQITTDQDVADVAKRSLLMVTLTTTAPAMTKTDAEAAKKLEAEYQSDSGTFKAQRHLWSQGGERIEYVKKIQRQARNYLNKQSKPLTDDDSGRKSGPRLVPVQDGVIVLANLKKYETDAYAKAYQAAYDHYDQDVITAKAAFVAELKRQTAAQVDTSAIDAFYLDRDTFFGRFSFSFKHAPVPSSTDYSRMGLDPRVAKALGNDMARRQAREYEAVIQDIRDSLVAHLRDSVAHVARRKADGERTKVYPQLLTHLGTLTKLLRGTNVLNDPALEQVAAEVDQLSQEIDLEAIRQGMGNLRELADKADGLAQRIQLAPASSQTVSAAPGAPPAPAAPETQAEDPEPASEGLIEAESPAATSAEEPPVGSTRIDESGVTRELVVYPDGVKAWVPVVDDDEDDELELTTVGTGVSDDWDEED